MICDDCGLCLKDPTNPPDGIVCGSTNGDVFSNFILKTSKEEEITECEGFQNGIPIDLEAEAAITKRGY